MQRCLLLLLELLYSKMLSIGKCIIDFVMLFVAYKANILVNGNNDDKMQF